MLYWSDFIASQWDLFAAADWGAFLSEPAGISHGSAFIGAGVRGLVSPGTRNLG